ncbi:MAG TPA: tryptophan--tRNA ligase [Gemmata sp.]|nr:tryptophan--tRNA ligase [Gemmata sp.]
MSTTTVSRECTSDRPRILSGVQPSGKLHIGNYFGAIRQHLELQCRGDCFYFIADYHALTTLKEAEEKEVAAAARNKHIPPRPARQILADNVHDVALDYLALGLDPAKAHFFRQSDIPEVCELTWILSTVSGMGLLERAHSYKDKVERGITPSVGLFTYPILMAADILIYRSHLVPVGKDQEQHLEMTRDIAGAFNHTFGEVFPLPDATFNEAAVVPGTDGQKMSKSYGNTIDIFAEGKALKNVVMSVVTDSTPVEEPKNPETCNVFKLLRLFTTGDELGRVADLYRNPMLEAETRGGRPFGYGDAKTILFGKIDAYFAPARERRKQLERNPGVVEEALTTGAKRAREVAQITLRLVRERVGMHARPV